MNYALNYTSQCFSLDWVAFYITTTLEQRYHGLHFFIFFRLLHPQDIQWCWWTHLRTYWRNLQRVLSLVWREWRRRSLQKNLRLVWQHQLGHKDLMSNHALLLINCGSRSLGWRGVRSESPEEHLYKHRCCVCSSGHWSCGGGYCGKPQSQTRSVWSSGQSGPRVRKTLFLFSVKMTVRTKYWVQWGYRCIRFDFPLNHWMAQKLTAAFSMDLWSK